MMERRTLLLCLLTAGCGFRPLYGGDAGALSDQIRFDPVSGRVGHWFNDRLRGLLTGNQQARWRLQINLSDSNQGLVVRQNDAVTRYNYRLEVAFKLFTAQGGEPIFQDRFEIVSAYNATASQFATLISERDAQKLAAEQAADRISRRVVAFLTTRPAS